MEARDITVRLGVVRDAQVGHHGRLALGRAVVCRDADGGRVEVVFGRRSGGVDWCGEGGGEEEEGGGGEEGEELMGGKGELVY